MLGIFTMFVVVFNDLVEEWCECLVAIVGTGVAANARVGVLASREDSLSEGEAELVFLILQLVPYLAREIFTE